MIIVCRLESASLPWLLDVVQGLLLHGSRWLGRVGHLGRGWRKVSVALDGGTAHRSRVHGNGLLRVERWLFLAIIKLFMSIRIPPAFTEILNKTYFKTRGGN